jgi:RNA polymerase sigma factor (TIGR02999 family)
MDLHNPPTELPPIHGGEADPALPPCGADAPTLHLPEAFGACYGELRRMARRRLRGGAPITLLDTHALVHEVYERLTRAQPAHLQDRGHFLAYVARAMRSIVIDAARERAALRRGCGVAAVALTEGLAECLPQADPLDDPDVLRVHGALEELAAIEPRLAQVVEMRFFGGMSHAEIGEALGRGLRTVERDWERARSFLYDALSAHDDRG